MLIVFSGTDLITVREKAHVCIESYERRGATMARLEGEDIQNNTLAAHAGAQSLFGGEEIIVIDMPSESSTGFGALVECAPSLQESTHTFVVIEGKLLAKDTKVLKKYASEFHEFKDEQKSAFNIFSLADALVRKDKKALWLSYMLAKREGLSGEEIIGTLLWQVKNIRLAGVSESAIKAGLKPFVYSKAKGGLKKYSQENLTEHAGTLLSIYHDGHAGLVDIDESLERWMLGL